MRLVLGASETDGDARSTHLYVAFISRSALSIEDQRMKLKLGINEAAGRVSPPLRSSVPPAGEAPPRGFLGGCSQYVGVPDDPSV